MWNVGNSYRRTSRSIGVLAFTWSLIAIVIVNAYNSSVISYLSASYKKPEVSTFKELAQNAHYKVLMIKGTVAEDDLVVKKCIICTLIISNQDKITSFRLRNRTVCQRNFK